MMNFSEYVKSLVPSQNGFRIGRKKLICKANHINPLYIIVPLVHFQFFLQIIAFTVTIILLWLAIGVSLYLSPSVGDLKNVRALFCRCKRRSLKLSRALDSVTLKKNERLKGELASCQLASSCYLLTVFQLLGQLEELELWILVNHRLSLLSQLLFLVFAE